MGFPHLDAPLGGVVVRTNSMVAAGVLADTDRSATRD